MKPSKEDIAEITKLVDEIRPILHGKHSLIQGSALAELVGIYLAGWVPQHQDKVIEAHISAVRDYAKLYRTAALGEGL